MYVPAAVSKIPQLVRYCYKSASRLFCPDNCCYSAAIVGCSPAECDSSRARESVNVRANNTKHVQLSERARQEDT